jgi:hypothetical protein
MGGFRVNLAGFVRNYGNNYRSYSKPAFKTPMVLMNHT